jgi:hypothetical protein
MTVLIKILSILTFVFAILLMLCYTSKIFVFFIQPVLFFTLIFSAITTLVGLFYYWGNNGLFYGHLAIIFFTILVVVLLYFVVFFFIDYAGDFFLWLGRIWTAMILVFYGLIIFKKLWIIKF